MLVVKINKLVAMHSIKRQQNQDNEVGNQQQHVEGVGLIQALEGGIEKMGLHVMAKPVRFHQRASEQAEDNVQKRTPGANVEERPERSASRKALPIKIVPEAREETMSFPPKR
jgi:hypothetical protein